MDIMIKIHLSRLLGEKRWTQKDLAEATGIRPSTINEWYHEFVTRINLDHVDKICEVLECDISDLIEYVPNQHKITGKDLIVEEHGNRKPKKSSRKRTFWRVFYSPLKRPFSVFKIGFANDAKTFCILREKLHPFFLPFFCL